MAESAEAAVESSGEVEAERMITSSILNVEIARAI